MGFRVHVSAKGRSLVAGAEPIATVYDMADGSARDRCFTAEVLKAGFTEERYQQWPCEAALVDTGEVLYRAEHEGVYRLKDGTLANVRIAHGWCSVRVASATRDLVAGACAAFAAAFPALYREETDGGTVPITFWTIGKLGPVSRMRMIDSASWSEIERNYAAAVTDELARLMGDEFEPGRDGQLLLWQGPPGTGKTWALRALASEWRDWCEFHYITDPDAFFVHEPSYMIDVLLSDTYEEYVATDTGSDVSGVEVVTSNRPDEKWRVLILEDTGELLAATAKDSYGQGLSRLLNVVDGMVGQGLRVLAVVTTNDELGELHPAVTRPGRCASQVVFGPLSASEASEWLGTQVEEEATLAELYEIAGRSHAVKADPEDELEGEVAALAELVALAASPLELAD